MKNFDDLLNKMSNNINYIRDIPMDGTLFSMSKYLQELSQDNSNDFFRRYINHLQYFVGIYDLVGDYEFNKISQILIRHSIEYGKVALTRFKGKLLPVAIVNIEYDIYNNITKCIGLPIRKNYSYTSKQTQINCNPDETIILKSNYLELPLLYFWRKPILTMMQLLQAAITGSVASIKKFKRNIQNNSSTISTIEELSFLDPTTPYISVIANPTGYAGINKRNGGMIENGNRDRYDIDQTTTPSSVEFSTINPDTSYLWENLNKYIEFEYYQLNRRINTNKKSERNTASEVKTETINFDVLDQEFKRYLLLFKQECKEKLNIDIEVKDFIIDTTPDENINIYNDENKDVIDET